MNAEPTEHFGHRGAARDGGEDDLGAAQLGERLPGIACGAIDVGVRAELLRELGLVGPARDGDCVEAHPRRVLHAEMSEPANAVHRDEIAGARAAVPQRVEGRHPRAHERASIHEGETIGDVRERLLRHDNVLGVAAIPRDPGHLRIDQARDEVAATARIAVAAAPAVPTDADAVTRLPSGHIGPERIDHPGSLVPRNTRICDPRPMSLDRERVAVTECRTRAPSRAPAPHRAWGSPSRRARADRPPSPPAPRASSP